MLCKALHDLTPPEIPTPPPANPQWPSWTSWGLPQLLLTHTSLCLWYTCPLLVHKAQFSWHLFREASPGPSMPVPIPGARHQEPLLQLFTHLRSPLSHFSRLFGWPVCLFYKTLSHLRAGYALRSTPDPHQAWCQAQHGLSPIEESPILYPFTRQTFTDACWVNG